MIEQNRRSADLKDEYYLNPILRGDYPDPSVLRVGEDYYMTHSVFQYGPGLLIWHSKDLVNWEPVCNAITGFGGNIYAPDFIQYQDKFYIYYPADGTNWVITADSVTGPWSEPVDLKIGQIDPGHCVAPDGTRFLYLSDGYLIQLSRDGLSVVGEMKKVYDGWQFPEEWDVEGFCLEGPKITRRSGYYYLTSAEGGTAGPATSHMVVSSRSKTPWGPWEHSPYNPIIHTNSRDDQWWSRGHGTLVDTPNGDWWMVYHAYEREYYTLGRQTLLEPIEWTEDGWFRVPEGTQPDGPIKKPQGQAVPHGLTLSDNFAGGPLGLQWRFFNEHDSSRYLLQSDGLKINGKGRSIADSCPMLCIPTDHSYEIEVTLAVSRGAEGGLTLFYNPSCYCGIGWNGNKISEYRGAETLLSVPYKGDKIHLRLRNDRHQVAFYYSVDREIWHKMTNVIETSGYHHNVFGEFISLRAGLYATGKGQVKFSNFIYRNS